MRRGAPTDIGALRRSGHRRRRLALVLAALVGACACGSPLGPPAPHPTRPPAIAAAVSPPAVPNPTPASQGCGDPTASLRPAGPLPPPNAMPPDTFMQRIHDRGRLIAGVSQDRLLFGYLDPLTKRIQGFDIDMVRQVARAIFGDEDRIDFRVVSSANRIQHLKAGDVDIVAATMTITCARLTEVAFSTVYYEAGESVLVASDSPAQGIGDLGGKRVCAAAGTTSLDDLVHASSQPVAVPVSDWTDCLVLFQEGEVDAILSDDTVLRGLQAQDPETKIVGSSVGDQPYGLGINSSHPDFVRYVNGVLERMRADGTWAASYQRWLRPAGPPPAPPAPTYRD